MKNSADFPLWKQLLCGIPRGEIWIIKASFWRGSFCGLAMCENQAYVVTICTSELLLKFGFLEAPSSLNKSGSRSMISAPSAAIIIYFGFLPQNLTYCLGVLDKINIEVCFRREPQMGKTNASSFIKIPRCKLAGVQLQELYICV